MFRTHWLLTATLMLGQLVNCSESSAQSSFSAEPEINTAEQEDNSASTEYINEDLGWSIALPSGWSEAQVGWDPKVVDFDNKDASAMFGVCVAESSIFVGRSLDEIADVWLEERVAALSKPHRLVSRERVKLPNGRNAVALLHEVGKGVVGKSQTVVFVARGRVVLLIGEAYADAWQTAKPDFDRLVESFRFESWARSQSSESTLLKDLAFTDYLYGGNLKASERALQCEITSDPVNDEARFCLGIVQLGLAIEHLVQNLNRHGFYTERTFGAVISPELRELFADQSNPEPFSNEVLRNMLQAWVRDVLVAEATLAEIKQSSVKLHLRPSLIRIDPVGQGKAVNAAQLLRVMFPQERNDLIEQFGLTLDLGDVHWLRGYLHLQAAVGEILLAHDFRNVVETCAHQVFEKVETPHSWLLEENRKGEFIVWSYNAVGSAENDYELGDLWKTSSLHEYFEFPTTVYLDAIAFVGQFIDLQVIEPRRFASALDHLERAIENAQEMWKFILLETDDDHEWIPNPRQRGSLEIQVTQPMIETWLDTLVETQLILRGEKLVPFWRDVMQGSRGHQVRGVNVRKVFQNPPGRSSVVSWIQGVSVSPYLERGELTEIADEEFLDRIDEVFGPAFPGFAIWFN